MNTRPAVLALSPSKKAARRLKAHVDDIERYRK